MKQLVIVSGGFDPLTCGHVDYFKEAAELGEVFCIMNNDDWLYRKKGKPFMPSHHRLQILESLRNVQEVFVQKHKIDDDVSKDIEDIVKAYRSSYDNIIFFKAGDRDRDDRVPEIKKCLELGIEVVYGKGVKVCSSSWYLDEWVKYKGGK